MYKATKDNKIIAISDTDSEFPCLVKDGVESDQEHTTADYDQYNGEYLLKSEIPLPADDELKYRVREIRDNALEQTDKYMISDFPITDTDRETMKQYRQYLRDYTKSDYWWERLPMTFDEYIADKAEPEAEEAEPEK